MLRSDLRALIGLAVSTGVVWSIVSFIPTGRATPGRSDAPAPRIGFGPDGAIRIEAADAGVIHYTLDGSRPSAATPEYHGPFLPDERHAAERLQVIPTSVQWRHPVGDFPTATVVRACLVDDRGRSGAVAVRTRLPAEASSLPVLSISIPPGAFFDADSGLLVPGNAIFHGKEAFVQHYPDDQKWWKYPGNYLYRGKRSERRGHIAWFAAGADATDTAIWSVDAGFRVNGNNTRGFPQHALRVMFDEPLEQALFGSDDGTGYRRILLRSSGNDQDRTFFRDALQHRLCRAMPFATAACVQSIAYVNGAYWGIHNIRQRLDDKEIARRFNVRPKDVTILADRLELYKGDPGEVKRFARLLTMSERWDANGTDFIDSLKKRMDVDGFLHYMAANIIFGNTDWPDQNGKWWRYTGRPDTLEGPRDGRWHFIMGDSDLSFGLTVGPAYDMFAHIDRHAAAPLSRLFRACMRSARLRARFRAITLELLDGPLSAGRMVAEAEGMRDAIGDEMHRHIRRWRRPLTHAAWRSHVEVLLTFARERGGHVRAQLDAHFPSEPGL